MKIQVEFLKDKMVGNYEIGRVPNVGEYLTIDMDESFYVSEVIHILDADQNQPVAIVRVG